jgi:hypothetical protein
MSHLNFGGYQVKTMTGRELEHRARDPDPVRRARLINDLQIGSVTVHRLTLAQARRLIPLRQRHDTQGAAAAAFKSVTNGRRA